MGCENSSIGARGAFFEGQTRSHNAIVRNLLIKLSELAVGLLRVLPTKPERSSPEPIQVQEKELESTEVERLSEEGLADNSVEINNPITLNPYHSLRWMNGLLNAKKIIRRLRM